MTVEYIPNVHSRGIIRTHDFVGFVRKDDQGLWVEGRNRFLLGDEVELIGPQMQQQKFRVDEIQSLTGELLPAGQPNSQLRLQLPDWAEEGDLLRLKRAEK